MPPVMSHIFKTVMFDRVPDLTELDVVNQAMKWVGTPAKPGLFLSRSSLYFLSRQPGGINQEVLAPGAKNREQSGGLRFEGRRPVLVPDEDYPGIPFAMLQHLVAAQAVELLRIHKAGNRLGPDPNMLESALPLTEVNEGQFFNQMLEIIVGQKDARIRFATRILEYMDAMITGERSYLGFNEKQGRMDVLNEKKPLATGETVGICRQQDPDTVVQVLFKPAKVRGQTASRAEFRDSVIRLCKKMADEQNYASLPMAAGDTIIVHFTQGPLMITKGDVYQALADCGAKRVGGRSAVQKVKVDWKDLQFMKCKATKESFGGLTTLPFIFAYSLHYRPRQPKSTTSSPNEGSNAINNIECSGLAVVPLTKNFIHGYDDHPDVVTYRAGDQISKAVQFYKLAGIIKTESESDLEIASSQNALEAWMQMRVNRPLMTKLEDIEDAVLAHGIHEGRDAIIHVENGRAVLCLGKDKILTGIKQTNEVENICSNLGIDTITIEGNLLNTELATRNYLTISDEEKEMLEFSFEDTMFRTNRIAGDETGDEWPTLALIMGDTVRPERYSVGGIQELYYDEVIQGESQAIVAFGNGPRRIVYAPRTLDAVVISYDTAGKRPQNGEVGSMTIALMDIERINKKKTEVFYPLGRLSTLPGFNVEHRRAIFEHLAQYTTHMVEDEAFVDPVSANCIIRVEYDGFESFKQQTTYKMKYQRAEFQGKRIEQAGILGTLPGEPTDFNLERLKFSSGSGVVDIGQPYLMAIGKKEMPTLRNARGLHLSSYIRRLSDLLEGDPKMVSAFGKKRGEGKEATYTIGVPLAQINPPHPHDQYPGGVGQYMLDSIRMGSLKQKASSGGRTLGFPYKELDPDWKQKYPLLAGRLEEAQNRGFKVQFNPPIAYDREGKPHMLPSEEAVDMALMYELVGRGFKKDEAENKAQDIMLEFSHKREVSGMNNVQEVKTNNLVISGMNNTAYGFVTQSITVSGMNNNVVVSAPKGVKVQQSGMNNDIKVMTKSMSDFAKAVLNYKRNPPIANPVLPEKKHGHFLPAAMITEVEGEEERHIKTQAHMKKHDKLVQDLMREKIPGWSWNQNALTGKEGDRERKLLKKARQKVDERIGIFKICSNACRFCYIEQYKENPYPNFTAHRQEVPWKFDQDIFDGSSFRTLKGKKFNQTRGMLNHNKRYSDLYDQGIAVQAIVGKIDDKWAVQTYRVPKKHKIRRLKKEIELDDAKAPRWYKKKHPETKPYGYRKRKKSSPIMKSVEFVGEAINEAASVSMPFIIAEGALSALGNPLEPISPTIISISGPSGSGKTTVAKHLLERIQGSQLVLSYTTRGQRPDEVDGFDKHFVTKESFEEMIEAGLFSTPSGAPLYQKQKNGHYYGRRYDELTQIQFPIVDVSFPGLRMLRKAFPNVFAVFIKTNMSESRRFEVMMQRGEMSEKEAKERVVAGTQMMKDHAKYKFDVVVENRFGKLKQTGGIIRKKFLETIDNPPGIPKPGKELPMEKKREIRKRWLELVNMTHTELKKFYDSDLGNKRAGLSRDEAKEAGISSGRDSALAILKMKKTPVADWHKTRSKDRGRDIMLDLWQWAQKQINFNTRHRSMQGAYLDDKGRPKRKLLGLWIWGHDPWRYALKTKKQSMPKCPNVPWVGSREKKHFGVREVKP